MCVHIRVCACVYCIKLILRVSRAAPAELYDRLLWSRTQDTDLVPSDIAAGLSLLRQQQDSIQNSQEPKEVVSHSPGPSPVSPRFCWVTVLAFTPICNSF